MLCTARELVEQNPEVTVIMHKTCNALINAGENDRTHGGSWCSKQAKLAASLNRMLHPEWNLSFPAYTARSKDILFTEDKETLLAELGLNSKIIHTPGHTIDSISVLDSFGNLFCGDVAANFLLWANTKYCPPFINDIAEYYGSWKKILELEVQKIYPAHGKPFKPLKLRKYMNAFSEDKLAEFNW